MKSVKLLIIILTGLAVVDCCSAGWFTRDDSAKSFQAGIAKLEVRKSDIFGRTASTITYDVQKTESLVTPIIGIVVVQSSGAMPDLPHYWELRFSYKDGKWTLDECKMRFGNAWLDMRGLAKEAQACFN